MDNAGRFTIANDYEVLSLTVLCFAVGRSRKSEEERGLEGLKAVAKVLSLSKNFWWSGKKGVGNLRSSCSVVMIGRTISSSLGKLPFRP
jgi:hypothetical protein